MDMAGTGGETIKQPCTSVTHTHTHTHTQKRRMYTHTHAYAQKYLGMTTKLATSRPVYIATLSCP